MHTIRSKLGQNPHTRGIILLGSQGLQFYGECTRGLFLVTHSKVCVIHCLCTTSVLDYPRTNTPTMHSCIMYSMFTQECVNTARQLETCDEYMSHDSLNSLVPSLPATRMSSSSPPGWNGRYGVMLYTFPLKADQASSLLLCCA